MKKVDGKGETFSLYIKRLFDVVNDVQVIVKKKYLLVKLVKSNEKREWTSLVNKAERPEIKRRNDADGVHGVEDVDDEEDSEQEEYELDSEGEYIYENVYENGDGGLSASYSSDEENEDGGVGDGAPPPHPQRRKKRKKKKTKFIDRSELPFGAGLDDMVDDIYPDIDVGDVYI